MERSLHDALCVVKRVLESKTVVPGGGSVEAALSIYLENLATSLVSFPFNTGPNFKELFSRKHRKISGAPVAAMLTLWNFD